MIDKKVLILIAVLIVVAILIVALSFVNISFGGRGDSFSALYDKMEERELGSLELVLPSSYVAGDVIKVRDKIIAIDASEYTTTFYFLYTGTQWINESSGSDFEVLQYYGGPIHVSNAVFGIHVSLDFSASFDVGDYISLQTTARISAGDPILAGNWVPIIED